MPTAIKKIRKMLNKVRREETTKDAANAFVDSHFSKLSDRNKRKLHLTPQLANRPTKIRMAHPVPAHRPWWKIRDPFADRRPKERRGAK